MKKRRWRGISDFFINFFGVVPFLARKSVGYGDSGGDLGRGEGCCDSGVGGCDSGVGGCDS
jgi:hypothetical protein